MATRKSEWLASIKPILDREEAKQDAKKLAQELSDILEVKVDTDADSLAELTKEFNNQLKQMGRQEIVFSEKTLQGIVSQFASAIAEGFAKGATLGVDEALKKQLEGLKKQREEIIKEQNKINQNIKARKRMEKLESFDIQTAHPIKTDGDVGKEAQKLVDILYESADKIDKAKKQYGKSSAQYRDTVLDAQEAYNKYLRMQKTFGTMSNSELFAIPKDIRALYDKLGRERDQYEAAGGLNIPFEEDFAAEKIMDAFEELSDSFESSVDGAIKLEKQLKQIDSQIDEIVKKIQETDSADDIIGDDVKSNLKSLQEIEAAYDRILKKKSRKSTDKFGDIKSAVDYVPGNESLAVLRNGYNKSLSNNEGWEMQYQWLVKFVDEYNAYTKKIEEETDPIKRKNMRAKQKGYDDLYKQISPLAQGAKESLQKLLLEKDRAKAPPEYKEKQPVGPTPEDVDNAQKIADAVEERVSVEKKVTNEFEKQANIVKDIKSTTDAIVDAAEQGSIIMKVMTSYQDAFNKTSRKNETLAFVNTRTGEISEMVEGGPHSVELPPGTRRKQSKQFDMEVHSHSFKTATPSVADMKDWASGLEYITQYGIRAGKELLAFDFSHIDPKQVQEIVAQYEALDNQITEQFRSMTFDEKAEQASIYGNIHEALQAALRSGLENIMKSFPDVMRSISLPELPVFQEKKIQPQVQKKSIVEEYEKANDEVKELIENLAILYKMMDEDADPGNGFDALSDAEEKLRAVRPDLLAGSLDWEQWDALGQRFIDEIKAEQAAHINNANAIQEEVDATKNLGKAKDEAAQLTQQNDNVGEDAEIVAKENGRLEDRLELLRDIADQYASNITQKQRDRYEELNQKDMDSGLSDKEEERYQELGEQIDAADQALEELGQTYDRIILKLANGRTVEILPDDKGLRSLYKFADEYGETYTGVEIKDVIFERVKQEATEAKSSVDELNISVKETKDAICDGGNVAMSGASSAELQAAMSENEALRQEIANKNDELERMRDELAGEAYRHTEARSVLIGQIEEAEAERDEALKSQVQAEHESAEKDKVIKGLREQLAQVQTGTGDTSEKSSVGAEWLKGLLESIVYSVKIVHDDVDKQANKIALDEGVLESTLNKVFANIINRPTQQNDGEQNQSSWALESTLQIVKSVLDNIQTNTAKIGIPNNDAVKGSTLTSTLGTIKSVIDAINGKIVQGTKVSVAPAGQPRSAATSTTGNPLLDAKIDTQFSSLSLLYAKLESNGKLTDEIRDKWELLWNSLDNVNDSSSLQLWNQQLTQVKNSIQEILIENNLLESESKASFNELVEITKLYNKMAAGAQNATTPELQSFYTDEANSLLVEQQRLLRDITLTKEQQAKIDKLDISRKREINKIVATQTDKQNQANLVEQANIIKKLNKLYQEYGTLVERASFAESNLKDEIESQIKEKSDVIANLETSLVTITPEIRIEFDQSVERGRKIESNKQYTSLAKKMDADEETRLKNIAKLEKEIGSLRADADNVTNDGIRRALNEEIKLREELIELQKQGLAMDEQDEAYYRKKLSNDTKLARSNAAQDKRERARVLNEQAKAEDKAWAKYVKNAQRETGINAADSIYKSANDSVLKAVGAESISEDFENKAKELSNQIKALRVLRDEIDTKKEQATEKDRDDLSKQISKVKELKSEVDEYLKIHEKYSGDNVTDLGNAIGFGVAGTDEYWNNITAAVKAQAQGRVVIQGMNADTGELTGTTKIAANTFATWSATVDPLTGRLSMLRTGIKKTETMIEAIKRKTKEIFTYFSGSSLIFKFFNELKKGVQYVKEIDLALTELKKVTDETEETYDKFLQTAAKTGSKIGSTISDVTLATSTFAKLGYNISQASEMAEAALVYQNVGDGIASADEAAESIISTMKGFKLEASDSMRIVDSFNEVGNRFSITSRGIGEALKRSASALAEGGNSLDESIGIITAANEVVQDPESVGK